MAAQTQLASVTHADGSTRRYHYENATYPRLLTGITDEVGTRIGTYTYDSLGRVFRSAGPGGSAAVELGYSAFPNVTVTDRSGATPVV